MAEFRFRVTPGIVPKNLLEKAYFAVWGRSPRPTQAHIEGNELIIRTNAKGSGTLHVPWPHRQLGLNVESTDSLLCRSRPYYLIRELGRGALGRLQKKLFEWQMLGFRVPPEIGAKVLDASKQFSKEIVSDPDDTDNERRLLATLELFGQIALDTSAAFTEQSLAWRTRNDEKLPVFLGTGIGRQPFDTPYEFDLYAQFLKKAFHAVLPMPSWRDLEPEPGVFCWDLLERRVTIPARFGFQIIMGPLICFDTGAFPAWMMHRLSEDGFFESRATRFVNAVAERYASQTDYWILANRFNSYHIKELPLSRAVPLVRLLGQQLRSRGLEAPILIGIDRPWGEYALQHVPEYDQIQIAESLMGSHEIDAFLMELNFGLGRCSTYPRDPMAVSSMIDQWSFLGKKVFVSISVPSNNGSEPFDGKEIESELCWSEELQQYWTRTLLSTLLSKRMVHGIFWSPLQDDVETLDDTKTLDTLSPPFSGLIDASSKLKQAFDQFTAVRKTYLKDISFK